MSRSTRKVAGLLLIGLLPGTAEAAELLESDTTATETDRSFAEAIVLSPTEKARSRTWGLSEIEWHRYQQLMQGIRGSVSPASISPIEVLGIHARDDQERSHYAERWAQAMHEDVERVLAFQHAYDAAGKRLYPNELLIDPSRLPTKPEATTELRSDDRLIFFARPDCPSCEVFLARLLKRLDQIAGIDLYLMGIPEGDEDGVREWAKGQGINPEWVRNRRLTLNLDGGALDRLTAGQGKSPYLLRRRGEELSVLPLSEL